MALIHSSCTGKIRFLLWRASPPDLPPGNAFPGTPSRAHARFQESEAPAARNAVRGLRPRHHQHLCALRTPTHHRGTRWEKMAPWLAIAGAHHHDPRSATPLSGYSQSGVLSGYKVGTTKHSRQCCCSPSIPACTGQPHVARRSSRLLPGYPRVRGATRLSVATRAHYALCAHLCADVL